MAREESYQNASKEESERANTWLAHPEHQQHFEVTCGRPTAATNKRQRPDHPLPLLSLAFVRHLIGPGDYC